MKALIKTIPHSAQPYPTCGDWRQDEDGTFLIAVSDMKNNDYHFLVAVHELVEAYLCRKAGITQQSVDEFDIAYEKQREKSLTLDTSEPGDSRLAPYERQHNIASGIERILMAELGVKIKDYEKAINAL